MIKIRTIHWTQVWGWKAVFLTHPGTVEEGSPTGTCPLGPVYRLHCWGRSFGSRACKSNALYSQGSPQSHLKCRHSSGCGSSCSTVLQAQTHTWINEQANDDWCISLGKTDINETSPGLKWWEISNFPKHQRRWRREAGTVTHCWWGLSCCSYFGDGGQFLTRLHILSPYDPLIRLLGVHPKELKTTSIQTPAHDVYSSFGHNRKTWGPPRYPLMGDG